MIFSKQYFVVNFFPQNLRTYMILSMIPTLLGDTVEEGVDESVLRFTEIQLNQRFYNAKLHI